MYIVDDMSACDMQHMRPSMAQCKVPELALYYHAMIRRIFNKTSLTYPKESKELCLAFAVKAINDTAGPNGLVTSLLIFGMLPRLPIDDADPPNLQERMKLMKIARDEYEAILAEKRVGVTLKKNTPPATHLTLIPGQPVYVYREKPLKKWIGPHRLVSCDNKRAFVDIGEKTGPRHFNLAQVKPAKLPSISSLLPNSHLPFQYFKPDQSTEAQPNKSTPTTSNAAPQQPVQLPPIHQLASSIPEQPGESITTAPSTRIMMTEILDVDDPRSVWFDDAKRKKIEDLIRRGTFKLILKEEIESDPNIVPSRFVLAIKRLDDGKELLKARFVLGGHRDGDRPSIVHNANTLKPVSTRLMLALAAIFGFDIWTTDINQAYLQSAANLQRRIFVRSDVLELNSDELLQVIKPLYGLSDAGDYWGETLTEHHVKDLKMEQSTGDFSLFFKKLFNKVIGISGTYVDDIICIGDRRFRNISNSTTNDTFDSKPDKDTPFTFTGFEVSRNRHVVFSGQKRYIDNLKVLSNGTTFSDFRSARAKLAWIVHSRPDIAFAVPFLSQVTERTFGMSYITMLNKAIRHLRKTSSLRLRFPKLRENALHLTVYSDASFNNNKDNTSQLGYVILLMDDTQRCCILQFSSHKSRRVTRSSMAAETLALVDGFDNAYILKHDLQRIVGKQIPLLHLIDSRILFDVITGDKYKTEKRLMVDIACIREAYKERTITNIGLISSEFNIADGLTKMTPNHALRTVMEINRIDHPVEQYVIDMSSASKRSLLSDFQERK